MNFSSNGQIETITTGSWSGNTTIVSYTTSSFANLAQVTTASAVFQNRITATGSGATPTSTGIKVRPATGQLFPRL